jgi:hypothetical protein
VLADVFSSSPGGEQWTSQLMGVVILALAGEQRLWWLSFFSFRPRGPARQVVGLQCLHLFVFLLEANGYPRPANGWRKRMAVWSFRLRKTA